MAACQTCNREMLAAPSCTPRPRAIAYGSESAAFQAVTYPDGPPERCHECGTKIGGTHHAYCDMEECGICGGQRLSCPHGPHG
jgi:hypothetical protein